MSSPAPLVGPNPATFASEKEWKSLPPLSSTRHAGGGGRFRPALDANGENVRDPGVESTSRKRRACVASEKAQALLGERKCAQKVLKGQVCGNKRVKHARRLRATHFSQFKKFLQTRDLVNLLSSCVKGCVGSLVARD